MKALLNRLFDYGQLTREEARELLVPMSAGELNPSQTAAFLSVFVMRESTADDHQLAFGVAQIKAPFPVVDACLAFFREHKQEIVERYFRFIRSI